MFMSSKFHYFFLIPLFLLLFIYGNCQLPVISKKVEIPGETMKHHKYDGVILNFGTIAGNRKEFTILNTTSASSQIGIGVYHERGLFWRFGIEGELSANRSSFFIDQKKGHDFPSTDSFVKEKFIFNDLSTALFLKTILNRNYFEHAINFDLGMRVRWNYFTTYKTKQKTEIGPSTRIDVSRYNQPNYLNKLSYSCEVRFGLRINGYRINYMIRYRLSDLIDKQETNGPYELPRLTIGYFHYSF